VQRGWDEDRLKWIWTWAKVKLGLGLDLNRAWNSVSVKMG
jgi:hypothetical protein